MCFAKNLTMTFLVRSPLKINKRVPASQARFQQFRVIELFCFESIAKSAVTVGHSSKDLQIIY